MIPVDSGVPSSGSASMLYRASWAAQRAVVENRLTEDLVQDVEDALLICKADGLGPELAAVVEVMIAGLRKWAAEEPHAS